MRSIWDRNWMRPGLQAALSGLIQFLSQMDLVASCLGPSFDFAEITLGPNGPRVISGQITLGPIGPRVIWPKSHWCSRFKPLHYVYNTTPVQFRNAISENACNIRKNACNIRKICVQYQTILHSFSKVNFTSYFQYWHLKYSSSLLHKYNKSLFYLNIDWSNQQLYFPKFNIFELLHRMQDFPTSIFK